ncbi:fasciclin domain-containing protein [Flavobacterium sp. NG2]|uniref:fasciclin domain-containing protein n=1 Tax=Flavobacterium sp. NG2 TaxID=3097547 RepID=UPI002A81C553|nr:fasciclin domain-containing protein [Flavobacterium sp. NG2]WPR70108.1 fasciclin domain-containing protein [Flavobacterium sp. NG2]
MKIKQNIKTYFTSLFAAVLVVSCNVPDDNTDVIHFVPGEVENPVTITQVIIKDPNFSTLEKLMRRIEKAATTPAGRILSNLNLPGNTTVFAPTDAAFDAFITANKITNIDNLPIATITNLVYNHLLTGKFLATDFTTGFISTQATRDAGTNLVNLSMYVNTASGVQLNGVSKVVSSNVSVNNGVIHTVDAVINVPTVKDLIALNPNTSRFSGAVTHADTGLATPVVGDALANTSNSVTAFVPTNAAIASLLLELDPTGATTTMQGLPSTQVANIVKINIVSTASSTVAISSKFFAARTNTKLQTLLSGTAGQVNFNGTTKKIVDPRLRTANITPLDIQGSNGVVHTVDKAMLPVLLAPVVVP